MTKDSTWRDPWVVKMDQYPYAERQRYYAPWGGVAMESEEAFFAYRESLARREQARKDRLKKIQLKIRAQLLEEGAADVALSKAIAKLLGRENEYPFIFQSHLQRLSDS